MRGWCRNSNCWIWSSQAHLEPTLSATTAARPAIWYDMPSFSAGPTNQQPSPRELAGSMHRCLIRRSPDYSNSSNWILSRSPKSASEDSQPTSVGPTYPFERLKFVLVTFEICQCGLQGTRNSLRKMSHL
jgi:hypothetical protein